MSDLTIELARPLPERLRVGRGNAVRIEGVITCESRITDLAVQVGDAEQVVAVRRRLLRRGSKRIQWSVLVAVSSIDRRVTAPVRVRATLSDGGEATARLGEIKLTPDLEAGLGGTRLVAERDRVIAAAEQIRAARPDQPLVAIAMATLDPEPEAFERQVESIRAQTHKSWICVVSDDSSAAAKLETMHSILGEDRRFVLIQSASRRGIYANFERALLATPAAADFVALCDQGDHWYPEKLETLVAQFTPNVQLAYSDLRLLGSPDANAGERPVMVSSWTRSAKGKPTFASLLRLSSVPGSASLVRRASLDYALPFPEHEERLRHDQWLALVALALGEVRSAARPLSDRLEPGDADVSRPPRPPRAPVRVAARVLQLRCDARLGRRERAILDLAARPDGKRPSRRARLGFVGATVRRRKTRRLLAVGSRTTQSAVAAPSAIDLALREPEQGSNGASVPSGRDFTDALPAIVVEGVRKSFRIPAHRPDTILQYIRHPLAGADYDRFDALTDVSFEVKRGEFFGIVGRNGSGKSTLLQILSNVYRPDEGTVMIAPRVAPIISLGIGFQPELSALDNVVLTATLLGVPADEAESRFAEVLAFAELEDFADLKLKNYSSGMRVRLAFATVLLVDADVLLLDELLAVGDEAFKQKASQAFTQLLADKTVVLVTHQMSHLQRFCNRALLLEGGRIEMIGNPEEVAGRYAEIALEGHGEDALVARGDPRRRRPRHVAAEIADLWLADPQGERAMMVPAGGHILVRADVHVSSPVQSPGVRLEIRNEANARIFAPPTVDVEPQARRLRRGERVQLETAIENKLAAGNYTIICTVVARPEGAERVVSAAKTARFAISVGPADTRGVIDLEHSVRITGREPEPERPRRRRAEGR